MKQDYILLQDKLKGEYKEAFQKVQMYSTSNLIGEDMESELMMELLDHMLIAQEEGKSVSTIVGDDIEEFCQNFFSEYKLGNRFLDFLKSLRHLAWVMLIFAILDLFFGDGGLSNSSDISVIVNVVVSIFFTLGLLLLELVLATPPMNEFAWHAAILIICECGASVFYIRSGRNTCATYAKMRARMKAENLTLAEYVAKDSVAE